MELLPAEILIFKTDIRCAADRQRAQLLLDNLPGINRWTVDCEDVDCVLRIESTDIQSDIIIQLLQHAGFFCTELPG